MMGRDGPLILLLSALLVLGAVNAADDLIQGFYNTSCPQAELIVNNITRIRAHSNSALGAKLLRMHFHDCFVRGCDASVLLDADAIGSNQTEKDAIPNQSLSGFDVIDEIKSKLEEVCPETVSCADILALAARDAVSLPFKKPLWEVLTGRRDGSVSVASEVNGNIPSPFSNFTTLMHMYSNKGLDLNDLVVLSGGHTIGVAHCATFTNRLHNFTGNGDMDPSLDKAYADFLKSKCPNPSNNATTVEMDPDSSLTFDKTYYSTLLHNKGLLQSDAALLQNAKSAKIVRQLNVSDAFLAEFAISMKKMGTIQVLTGYDGQIRKNCRVVKS